MAVANGCSAVACGETRPEDPGYEDSRGSRRDSVGAYSGGNCYLVKTDFFGPPYQEFLDASLIEKGSDIYHEILDFS